MNFAVELPALPSTMRTSSIDIRGTVSSSRIVPWPCASAITPKSGFDRSTVNVSFGSSLRSPTTGTSTETVVVPGGKLARPLAAWKSESASVAVPSFATQSTSTSCELGKESEIVKRALVVPLLPSASETSSIVMSGGSASTPHQVPQRFAGDAAYSWIVQRSTSLTGSTCAAL